MEEENENNAVEQVTGEILMASGPTNESVPGNSEGPSGENAVGASDGSSAANDKSNPTSPKTQSESHSHESQPLTLPVLGVPAASSSGESDSQNSMGPKVTFKVPDLSKVIRKPKVVPLSQLSPADTDSDSDASHTNTSNTDSDVSSNTSKVKKDSQSTSATKEKVTASSSSSKLGHLSPAEKLKQLEIPLPYKEPPWGGLCDKPYSFEVLKNGAIIDTVDLKTKTFHVIGRLPSCDVTLEHPSLSRHHVVIQYCEKANEQYTRGWYLYDLDSTHGTWINKNRVRPKEYYRIKVGYVLKFGGSTRLFIMQGPDDDADEESELSVTELKEQRQKQKMEMELRLKQAEEEEELKRVQEEQEAQDKGCSWGMFDEDIADEAPESENPFALPDLQNEDLYIDDPKKALKGYYEREGLDPPEYKFEDVSFGQHKCSVELPIDDTNTGKPIIVEVQVSGKKKEAVIQCALEACRMLDRYGELRKANQESRKKKGKNWEEQDFYDSDEDTYLDRTGEIERKRQQRMKKAGKLQEKAETYESLVEKLTEVQNQVKELEEKISQAKKAAEADSQVEGLDALDAFMTSIKSGAMDTKTRMKLKLELLELRKEQQRLAKLVNVARPATLPPVQRSMSGSGATLPMVGKVRALNKSRIRGPAPLPSKPANPEPLEDEDEEEDEDEDAEKKPKAEVKKIKLFSVPEKPPSDTAWDLSMSKDSKTTLSTDNTHSGINSKSPDKSSEKDNNSSSTQETVPVHSAASKSDDVIQQHKKKVPMVVESTENKEEDIQKVKETHQAAKEPETKQESGGRRRKAVPRKSTGEMVKKMRQEAMSKEYSTEDPDYAVWVPPTGQTGDGKTSLNEKYGY